MRGSCMMLRADATFEAALPPLCDSCLKLGDLRMEKRMGIDGKDPEVSSEGIVRNAVVLGEDQIPSNMDEYPT
jgi:hypothetical protein